jgi:WD40 repeat protein
MPPAARGEPLRHDGPVLSLTFSPDGKLVVTGSYDGTVRLWDVATCRQHGPALPHLGRVHAVAVRFDGQFVATGSSIEDRDHRTGRRTAVGGEVRLWHAATGELFGEPMRHSQPVWSVAFRPGGGKLLAGGRDRAARFYSLIDGTLLGKPLDHEGTVANVVFSPNGRLALTASAGGDNSAHARLWELAPGDPVVWSTSNVPAEGQRVRMTSFAPDGRNMLGVAGNRAREYDVVTGQPAGQVLAHDGGVRSAYYGLDGRSILTAGERYDVRYWDRASGREIGASPDGAEIVSLNFSATGEYVAIRRGDRTVSVHRVPTGEVQGPILKLLSGNSEMVLRPDGQAVYGHDEGGVRELDVHTGKVLRVWKVPGTVRFLRFVKGKAVVVLGQGSHLARAWELETHQPMSGPLADLVGNITEFAFSPDGSSILTGMWDRHNARLWDTATGKPIGPPVQHGEAVYLVAFTPDGTRMMSISVNGEFRSQQVPLPLPGDPERIRCWVEVLTGMELDSEGTIWDLDADTLQQRRELLNELGGPPDRMDRP